jgi:tetratricopeptide (TPR) repeat protein
MNCIRSEGDALRRATRRVRGWSALSLALALALVLLPRGVVAQGDAPLPAGGGDRPASGEPEVEVEGGEDSTSSPSLRDAVAAARAAVAACKGTKGEERVGAMTRAAAAWAEVARVAGGDATGAARGHFECGVVWRRLGRLAEADAALSRSLEVQREGRYVQRALYERAQVRRRQKRFEEAVEDYREASLLQVDGARAHQARIWAGKTLAQQGKQDEAITELQGALENATNPKYLIQTCNELARLHLRAGAIEQASAVVAHADEATQEVRARGGKVAERLQRDLERMSARKALQRIRDDAQKVADDAEQLEEDLDEDGGD